MYTVTAEKVNEAFSKINTELFYGELELSDVELDIDYLDTELGFCVEEDDGSIVLGLTNEFNSKEAFLDTLCHEMIHLWQIMNCWKVHHGDSFRDYADKALKFGYTV